jgi:hypothetical protein
MKLKLHEGREKKWNQLKLSNKILIFLFNFDSLLNLSFESIILIDVNRDGDRVNKRRMNEWKIFFNNNIYLN